MMCALRVRFINPSKVTASRTMLRSTVADEPCSLLEDHAESVKRTVPRNGLSRAVATTARHLKFLRSRSGHTCCEDVGRQHTSDPLHSARGRRTLRRRQERALWERWRWAAVAPDKEVAESAWSVEPPPASCVASVSEEQWISVVSETAQLVGRSVVVDRKSCETLLSDSQAPRLARNR